MCVNLNNTFKYPLVCWLQLHYYFFFQVGNTELHAHRAVLASASPYLFEMFSSEEEAKGAARETVITYKLNGGFERSAIEKLVDYAYTAK